MEKCLREDLTAEVLGGAIPVQHRHLPDPTTKFTSFYRGQLLNHWSMEASWFSRPTNGGFNSNFDHGHSGRAQQGLLVKWEWLFQSMFPPDLSSIFFTVTDSPTLLPEAMPLAPQAPFRRASYKWGVHWWLVQDERGWWLLAGAQLYNPNKKMVKGGGINVRTKQHRIMGNSHLCFKLGVTIYPFVYVLSLDVFVLGWILYYEDYIPKRVMFLGGKLTKIRIMGWHI